MAAGQIVEGLTKGIKLNGSSGRKLTGVASMDKSGPEIEALLGFVESSVRFCMLSKDVGLLSEVKSMQKKINKMRM